MRPALARVALLSLLECAVAAANPPAQSTAFTYQGSLNANGHPAAGNFDLTFRLFDADTAGNQIGTAITLTQYPVVNGVFTADLNFPGAFSGSQLWLEVTVGTETLIPRQPVNAVPVAQYALSGNPGSVGPAGKNSLLAQAYEPAGPNCSVAGIKVTSGVDSNGNGVLDPAEVTATSYICGSSPPVPQLDPTCTHQPISTSAINTLVTHLSGGGTNITPDVGDSVTLQTTPSDPNSCSDGTPLTPFTYRWTLQKPPGSTAALSASDTPTFVPDVVGVYAVSVTVADSQGNVAAPAPSEVVTSNCGSSPIAVNIVVNPSVLPNPASLAVNAYTDDNNPAVCPPRFFSLLTFEWSVLSAPLPSYWQFSSPTFASTQLLPSTVGTYFVGATVRGAHGNSGSLTLPLTFTETPAVALASSLNPAPAGQIVTFTATVTPSLPGSGTPTGSVTFLADSAQICSGVALDSSTHSATCTTNALSGGQVHAIAASYGGDANFTAAQATLQQTVN